MEMHLREEVAVEDSLEAEFRGGVAAGEALREGLVGEVEGGENGELEGLEKVVEEVAMGGYWFFGRGEPDVGGDNADVVMAHCYTGNKIKKGIKGCYRARGLGRTVDFAGGEGGCVEVKRTARELLLGLRSVRSQRVTRSTQLQQ